MVDSNQLSTGMVIMLDDGIFYKVVYSNKVTMPKGDPIIKVRLKNVDSEAIIDKSFKVGQEIKEMSINNRVLEFLYKEGDDYLFFDIKSYDKLLVSTLIMEDKISFLKAGIQVSATVCGESVFAIELPHFLELMVSRIDSSYDDVTASSGLKKSILETGACLLVPPFIEPGDIIKIDTRTSEYIQRV